MPKSRLTRATRNRPLVLAEVDQIAATTPRIQDARAALARLALREKTALVDLVDHFIQGRPAQTFHCHQCHQDVPLYEFAGTTCLDCVQANYEEHFRGR